MRPRRRGLTVTYPDGYQDPPYDGTAQGFGETVIPARADALLTMLNEHLAGHGYADLRFEYAPPGEMRP